MKSEEELLSFLDLIDLDEEIIDKRLMGLMLKSHFNPENLSNLLHLLQYKHLINTKEDTECDNDQELSMITNLLSNLTEHNVQTIGKIIFVILILKPSTIVSNAEHVLQQVLADMYVPTKVCNVMQDNEIEKQKVYLTLFKLKICKSVLDAVIYCRQKLLMPFLDIPLEHLIYCQNEELKSYFVTSIISQIFQGIAGYHILDRIWNLIKQSLDQKQNSLKILCSLSNYYLPVANYESNVIYSCEFWDIILYGLSSDCNKNRKFSMYLFKRALDCLKISKRDVQVKSECTFIWKASRREELNKIWDDFFILIDSLEEKQSNIVLPSLILISTVKDVGYCWLNCAFKIGLSHDNAQVRFKCIQYRLDYPIYDCNEAYSLLEALNDTHLFGDQNESKLILNKMKTTLIQSDSLINILKTMPNIKWAPVPLFYTSKLLTELNIKVCPKTCKDNFIKILHHLFKISCTNIIIRKAVFVNLFTFIGKCCYFNIVDYITLCGNLPPEIVENINSRQYGLDHNITNQTLTEDENKKLLELLALYPYIDFALLYCSGDRSSYLTEILEKNIDKIKDICDRQYSKKYECIAEAIYLTEFYGIIRNNRTLQDYDEVSCKICKVLLNYVKSLLSSDTDLDNQVVKLLNEGFDIIISNSKDENKETLTQIFKYSLLMLNDVSVDLNKRVLSILTLVSLLTSPIIFKQYVTSSDLLTILVNGLKFNNKESSESIGRLKNIYYEKSSQIFYLLLENQNVSINNDVINFIDDIFQSGGYGCLNWILKIMNKLLPQILQHKQYDIPQFLSRAWIGIEELKTNSQYAVCMKEFTSLLMHNALLEESIYNNVILSYCTKIIDYGAIKTLPLYYLIKQIHLKNISICGPITYIFTEILLYTTVPNRENRILENVIEELLRETQYGTCKTKDFHFASHIRYLSIEVLSKITDTDVLKSITSFIIQKVDEMFKNKQRYHGNSQAHRTVQAALQNLLFITLKCRLVNVDKIGHWCIELLGKLPHQQFVRTCLEWYISLFIYIKDIQMNNDTLKLMQSRNVPITSQFLILYYVIMHKIKSGSDCSDEYQFVMDTFLSHTMGPTYSTRLYAQYLAHRLKLSTFQDKSGKYDYTLEVIEQTLNNASAEKEKTYQKLLKDYFIHKFDIVEDLTPWRIFHYRPTMDNVNENVDEVFFKSIMQKITTNLKNETTDSFYNEWIISCKSNQYEDNFEPFHPVNIYLEKNEVGTIQKKYIPWKNMSDINISGIEEKKNKSDLIVVASLIDRLPNLGGMARTSEVFGVLTYVVDSLRHLQDKQFQGLSVSAEHWINVEEVRPGQPLKDYLMMKKSQGFSIVAAEQTSSSSSLQTFKFPKKTLLLLGHEKEGVPCDLLPIMDYCVEIPQQGVIRSLNVHVTAAIFIWEYARQNML